MGKDRFFANWEEDEEDKWEDVEKMVYWCIPTWSRISSYIGI
jgi:hypothetical protein